VGGGGIRPGECTYEKGLLTRPPPLKVDTLYLNFLDVSSVLTRETTEPTPKKSKGELGVGYPTIRRSNWGKI